MTLDWARDGHDWPHREASRFIEAAGLRWHVQRTGLTPDTPGHAHGRAPVLLLLHGTGGALHSWRDFAPLFAPQFDVIAVDLPGHGFTATPPAARMSLPGMARALADLLIRLGVQPQAVIGHSAGAAIAARMALDGLIAPRALVGLNAAMLPLHGLPGLVFAPMARLLAGASFVPRLFAWRAQDAAAVERLVSRTGSTIDTAGLALYARLVSNPGHVAGALAMMANWDLEPLLADLPRLVPAPLLVVGANDATLPPDQATRVAARVPGAQVLRLPGLGHLAHEEQPQTVARAIAPWLEAAANTVRVQAGAALDSSSVSGG
jgi:magnesium chelatase accessory protein